MVRMSDLFKKAKGEGEPEENRPAADKKTSTEERAPEKTPGSEKSVEFAKVLYRQSGQPPKEDMAQEVMQAAVPDENEAKKIYFEAIKAVQNIFNAYKDGAKINKEDLLDVAHKLGNNIILGSHELLKLFHELDSLKLHRYYNAVNVSILSVAIGTVYKYNKSILVDLAIIGLLHDLDLIKQKDAIDRPGKLKKEELKEVRQHSLNIATYIDHAFNFKEEIVKSILQHHERRKGQGYPDGLLEDSIYELAAIVGIADTYEAMTHSRPYKKKLSPHTAIMAVVSNAKVLFPNELTKALVSCIGLYPLGSWVELNTGEICKVLAANPDSPLRPVISVAMDKQRNRLKQTRTVDLHKIPSLYIKQAVEMMQ